MNSKIVRKEKVAKLSMNVAGRSTVVVDRTVDHEERDDAAVAQAGDEGGGFPVAVRHAQALATRTPTEAPSHVGAGPTLIDEHQPVWIEIDLPLELGPALPQHIRAVLLGGVRGLFLRVRR